jgi:hypothetical protein
MNEILHRIHGPNGRLHHRQMGQPFPIAMRRRCVIATRKKLLCAIGEYGIFAARYGWIAVKKIQRLIRHLAYDGYHRHGEDRQGIDILVGSL